MADFSYDSYVEEAGPTAAAKVRRLTRGMGAMVSAALIVGLVIWAWQIAVREARGVPVIRALEGAMRVAPDDPGGVQMAHQGLAVNNVAAVGEVAAPADRLMLAPRPVELTDRDHAGYAPIPASAVVPTLTPTILAAPQVAEEGTSTAVLEGDVAMIDLEPEASADAPQALPVAEAADVVASPVPLDISVAQAVDQALFQVAEADREVVLSSSPSAVATSPRPMARPRAAPVAVAAAEPARVTVLDGTTIAPGTRLVQLGAYDDEAAALKDWQKLAGTYDSYFKGKEAVIQQAVSGGKTFYRLRANGFADEDEARRFCAVLLNDRAQCIPVRVR